MVQRDVEHWLGRCSLCGRNTREVGPTLMAAAAGFHPEKGRNGPQNGETTNRGGAGEAPFVATMHPMEAPDPAIKSGEARSAGTRSFGSTEFDQIDELGVGYY